MSILSTSNFSNGKYAIPTNPKQDTGLQLCIDQTEGYYLPLLFGVELYNLFIADLDSPVVGEPTDPRFVQIYNPFIDQTNDLIMSDGIVEMLKGFVYFMYLRERNTTVTNDGFVRTLGENSETVTAVKHDLTRAYNEAVDTFKVVQYYMETVNDTDYPEFDGVYLNYNHNF